MQSHIEDTKVVLTIGPACEPAVRMPNTSDLIIISSHLSSWIGANGEGSHSSFQPPHITLGTYIIRYLLREPWLQVQFDAVIDRGHITLRKNRLELDAANIRIVRIRTSR